MVCVIYTFLCIFPHYRDKIAKVVKVARYEISLNN